MPVKESEHGARVLGYLRLHLDNLRRITEGCRLDMHEPDEQDVEAEVVGTKLDNAFGEHIDERALDGGFQELVVILRRRDMEGKMLVNRINLATLIALARQAQLE
jgi:hypothetical protein